MPLVLQMNNSILRDVLKENDFVIDILESDQKTINLLNFQIADILVSSIGLLIGVGLLKDRGR